jgi:hypothetical protein
MLTGIAASILLYDLFWLIQSPVRQQLYQAAV